MRGNAAWPESSDVQIGQLDKKGEGGGGAGMLNHTRPLLTTVAEHRFIPGGSQWTQTQATTPVCTVNNSTS